MKKWIALGTALLNDRPWHRGNSRSLLFTSVVLAGLVAGAVEGTVIHQPVVGASDITGDGYLWDTIAFGAWMGAAAGHAAALALIAARNLVLRTILAGAGGICFVPGALMLCANGVPQGSWEGYFHSDTPSLVTSLGAWGIWIGGPLAVTIAVVGHLSRRCFGKPRLLLLVAGVSGFVGFRSQTFFWDNWVTMAPSTATCYSKLPAFGAFAGILFALSTMAVLLLLSLVSFRISRRWLSGSVGVATAVIALGLSGAVHAMPFAEMSEMEDMAVSEDGRSLLTTHCGNALRTWRLESDKLGHARAREIRKIRLPHGVPGRDRVALHPSYVACITTDAILLLDVVDLRCLARIPLSGNWWWSSSDFSADSRTLALGDYREVRRWKITPDEDGLRYDVAPLPTITAPRDKKHFLRGNSWYTSLDLASFPLFTTHSIATLSTDAEILAANGEGKSYVWNSADMGTLMRFQPPLEPLVSTMRSPDDRLLLLSTDENHYILDLQFGKVLIRERRGAEGPRKILASPDYRWIAMRSGDKELKVWKWPRLESIR